MTRSRERGQALLEMAVALPLLLLIAAGVAAVTTMIGSSQQLSTAVQAAAMTAAREQTASCPETGGVPDAVTSAAFYADLNKAPVPAGEVTVAALTLQCVNEGSGSTLGSIGCSYDGGALGPGGAAGCVRGDFIVVTATVHVHLTWLPGFVAGLASMSQSATAGAQRQPYQSVG